ncbi:hypothetical protein [Arundinibacter roseus]|uniref:Lipocalin-like domain-containing protein n=1 Tax=Arundinibacter roseus TaxID=2070510 RepID=A0A4R4KIC2_9BACT|nr:hypothetical protein [Arundinibacter roseus]TDB67920.1 hypothetical protein EZE20_03050 [Arundinibacter roseus]
MKNLYSSVLLAVLLFSGCTQDQPLPDSGGLAGTYRTNGILDPSCVAISDDRQLPTLTIRKESDGSYQLTRTDFIPNKRTMSLSKVQVEPKSDSLVLFYQDQKIGHVTVRTWPKFEGKKVKDTTSPVLFVNYNNPDDQAFLFYIGYRE